MNYRDNAPVNYKELTSDGILAYFEDERATDAEINWIQQILTDADFQTPKNPVSKWNWAKIKTEFALAFFPDVAPAVTTKTVSIDDRVAGLLNL